MSEMFDKSINVAGYKGWFFCQRVDANFYAKNYEFKSWFILYVCILLLDFPVIKNAGSTNTSTTYIWSLFKLFITLVHCEHL